MAGSYSRLIPTPSCFDSDSPEWLAGILEGEGSFQWWKPQASPLVCLSMTDKDIVSRVAHIFRSAVGTERKRCVHYKPLYRTRAVGKRALEISLRVFPYLGERRRGKINELLSRWEHGE